MNDPAQGVVEQWQRLKQQYGWSCVADETAFLAQISAAEAEHLSVSELRTRLLQVYNQQLFAAFIAQWEDPSDITLQQAQQATEEIWRCAYRIATRYVDRLTAEDIAQAVLEVLIQQKHSLRKPAALTAWLVWRVRDLLTRKVYISESHGSPTVAESVATSVYAFESHLIDAELLTLLEQILSARQLCIIKHSVLEGRPPREVARKLGLKDYQVRVEKSRALHLLRTHPAVARWIGD